MIVSAETIAEKNVGTINQTNSDNNLMFVKALIFMIFSKSFYSIFE